MTETEVPEKVEPYPEHQKLKAIRLKSQAIGEFLEWLSSEHDITLAAYDEDDNLRVTLKPKQILLAQFFEIDQDVLEREKRHMLEQLRS
jgi:hypothetical protein